MYAHEGIFMHWDFSPSVLLLEGPVSVVILIVQKPVLLNFWRVIKHESPNSLDHPQFRSWESPA